MLSNSFWPGFFAFFSVFFATLVLIEFGLYVASRYRERFLEEAGTELDDVLIQIPAGRVLDLSFGIATSGMIVAAILFSTQSESFSWKWGWLLILGIGLVLFWIPRLVLRYLRSRRLQKFNIQLEEALGIIASSLKAGFSINQSLDEVADQNIHPVSVEFRLLTQEIRLGVPLEQALENMNRRLGSEDFELVATAILTARQTGGELTGTLERVAALIRERVKISNKVRALTAMGRLQAIVISLLPFVLMFMMSWASPALMSEFYASPLGVIAVILVVILDVLGFLWIRKITAIDV
ncbi:MAG: type II secretion system F family protein [Victivallales bacterium]|jgi:tight adherence protein B|nr:type II secretion system F family protein [Victivallales bacterium]